jgi:hypothetical protein
LRINLHLIASQTGRDYPPIARHCFLASSQRGVDDNKKYFNFFKKIIRT